MLHSCAVPNSDFPVSQHFYAEDQIKNGNLLAISAPAQHPRFRTAISKLGYRLTYNFIIIARLQQACLRSHCLHAMTTRCTSFPHLIAVKVEISVHLQKDKVQGYFKQFTRTIIVYKLSNKENAEKNINLIKRKTRKYQAHKLCLCFSLLTTFCAHTFL